MNRRVYTQRGENDKYPRVIETWTWGEDIPEWLSDQAKVSAIDSTTNKVFLEVRRTSSGGYELLTSSGQETLLKTKNLDDHICRDTARGGLFVLTNNQFKLLYYGANV